MPCFFAVEEVVDFLEVDGLVAAQSSGCPTAIHPTNPASKHVRATQFIVVLRNENSFMSSSRVESCNPDKLLASNDAMKMHTLFATGERVKRWVNRALNSLAPCVRKCLEKAGLVAELRCHEWRENPPTAVEPRGHCGMRLSDLGEGRQTARSCCRALVSSGNNVACDARSRCPCGQGVRTRRQARRDAQAKSHACRSTGRYGNLTAVF